MIRNPLLRTVMHAATINIQNMQAGVCVGEKCVRSGVDPIGLSSMWAKHWTGRHSLQPDIGVSHFMSKFLTKLVRRDFAPWVICVIAPCWIFSYNDSRVDEESKSC